MNKSLLLRLSVLLGLGLVVLLPSGGAQSGPAATTESEREGPEGPVGKPAPAFKAPLLGGGEVDLAALKGRKVVILDFWASWCAPCVKSLPATSEVAGAYKDKGVALYAVNAEEEPRTIRAFLRSHRLRLAVVLDRDGSVAALFGVDALPYTVIIDRTGLIRAVHEGYTPDLKKRLREELEALMAVEARRDEPSRDRAAAP